MARRGGLTIFHDSWGGLQVLIPLASRDTSKAKAWMKEISTDGNVQTVADLLPQSFPAFFVLAPDYMRLLLEPILEYAMTWPAEFGFHDLGKRAAPSFIFSPFFLLLCIPLNLLFFLIAC